MLGMCMGAVGYKVDGRRGNRHGFYTCISSWQKGMHVEFGNRDAWLQVGGVRGPQHCSDLSHTEALDFLHWCQGNVGKFNLEP